MSLIQFNDYCKIHNVSERTLYRYIQEGKVIAVEEDGKKWVVNEASMNEEARNKVVLTKKEEWNRKIKYANLFYRKDNKPTQMTSDIIKEIETEVEYWSRFLGMKIKGFDKRSLQMKVKDGRTERKTRNDKFTIRNRVLIQPGVFDKAHKLVSEFYIKDPLHSLQNAVDRVIELAKMNEELWEIAAINIYTLKRHVKNAFKASGMSSLSDYMNHYNKHNEKLAYVKGSFTDDIEFMDVYSLDDHKFDVAGALVWDDARGDFMQKKIYSWVCVEMKTMMILGYEIKGESFKDEDIVRMMMKVLKKWGAPKNKVICDQGLGADQRVKDFFNKLGIILEPQAAYSPTKKANNERIFKFFKNETDIYNENYVGSNHPVEGRHRGLRLSPEETTELMSEAVKRYDKYISEYYQTRPRAREIKGIEHLKDNTGRISIRALFDFYYQTYEKIEVSDRMLRYAYMKYDVVMKFENYYMKFKKELYLPVSNTSLIIHDPYYKYIVAYNPEDLNTIDLYAAQDIMDKINGEFIAKGDYVCSLESLANLSADEKKAKVGANNKRFNKALNELAKTCRENKSELINAALNGDGALVNIRREQERQITKIIKESIPMDKIEVVMKDIEGEVKIDTDKAFTEEAFDSLNDIKIDE